MTSWLHPHRLRGALARALGGTPPLMQVGALCQGPGDGRVLLITSRDTGRWVIPKGWPMTGRSLAAAALQEAWEEAGVRGEVGRELGRYRYGKVQDEGFSVPVEVRIFPVRVSSLADAFPEAGQRTRRWFDPAEAADRVAERDLARVLRRQSRP